MDFKKLLWSILGSFVTLVILSLFITYTLIDFIVIFILAILFDIAAIPFLKWFWKDINK